MTQQKAGSNYNKEEQNDKAEPAELKYQAANTGLMLRVLLS